MVIGIAVSLSLVIIHDVHAVLMLIPGQNSEQIYIAPNEMEIYYAFIIIPVIHSLLAAVISGLSLGLSTRMSLTQKYMMPLTS